VIVISLPIMIIVITILRYTGEGEIFYKQKRIGIGGLEFDLLKFATMVKNSPYIGAGDITLKNDPRVLPFGKLLRKSKLNEFPQFLNVILGDMSIVGPRPIVKNQYEMIPKENRAIISKLKPGITGIGSIIFRDEEKYFQKDMKIANEIYKQDIVPFKSELECWYFDNHNLWIDTLILFNTLIIIIIPRSIIHKYFFRSLPKHDIFNP